MKHRRFESFAEGLIAKRSQNWGLNASILAVESMLLSPLLTV